MRPASIAHFTGQENQLGTWCLLRVLDAPHPNKQAAVLRISGSIIEPLMNVAAELGSSAHPLGCGGWRRQRKLPQIKLLVFRFVRPFSLILFPVQFSSPAAFRVCFAGHCIVLARFSLSENPFHHECLPFS